MSTKRRHVLMLFDVPYAPPAPGDDFLSYMHGDEWKDERDVAKSLLKLGHRVTAVGLHDSIEPLLDLVKRDRPDVIFNLCESFNSDRKQEANLPALLELLGVPYTGARPEALAICKDKGLTKKILTYHDVRVPQFSVVAKDKGSVKAVRDVVYPSICKPLGLDASEGIAQNSLVTNEADCLERVQFIHDKLGVDAIIEEYIDGRELYVGVFGNERLTVLPPQELFFGQLPNGTPRVLTYNAKWNEDYRKKYGIDSDHAKDLPAETLASLAETSKQVYRLCKLSGYARIDLRLGSDGAPVIIEVNPNPSIKRQDDFAAAAKQAGIPYEQLIGKLINLALAG
jgi:D-alanine-D-alanine ligase